VFGAIRTAIGLDAPGESGSTAVPAKETPYIALENALGPLLAYGYAYLQSAYCLLCLIYRPLNGALHTSAAVRNTGFYTFCGMQERKRILL
jgi:hypothetical protein